MMLVGMMAMGAIFLIVVIVALADFLRSDDGEDADTGRFWGGV